EQIRRQRLGEIRENGINPYPSRAHRSHECQEVLDNFDELEANKEQITVCGRLRAIRKHGGISFINLSDASGNVQIVLHKQDLGDDIFGQFHNMADLGDFYEFSGNVFLTQRGEQSIKATSTRMLAKSLLPLPEKWHGLTDQEIRYRQRYLDLIANEESMAIAKSRAKMVRAMREYLEAQDFLEVETPILQPIPGGANARPFVTHHNTLHADLYLRIAPELYLKRLVVGGFEKVYEFARCFRNEGISTQHNPEFTQIEAYWAYATIENLIDHLEGLVKTALHAVTSGSDEITFADTIISFKNIERKTFRDVILEHTGIDLDGYKDETDLRNIMVERGINVQNIYGYGELVDTLYKHGARLKIIQPVFVTDYPSAMKPLAKRRENNPFYSASAQLVVMGMEMCNAFNELNDPLEQEDRFREQESLREQGSEEAQRIDEDYITALKHGMPPTAGYGIGIDRLAMLLTGSDTIKDVILFPTLKPRAIEESESTEVKE
ncbi:lysine--tRNA ligase, partial [Patescibacteria group bacterium]|nr:lysine--tRNA ligase [Patescibacteria group bacterium]